MAEKDASRECICNATTVQEARMARRAKPQPWIVLKFAVGFAIALIGYSGYVYIGRLCIPMVRRDSDAFGSRVMGSECC